MLLHKGMVSFCHLPPKTLITNPGTQKQARQTDKRVKSKKKVWAAILTLSGMCSIFVNIVNHRLADGGVNCTCGNNMTQRMLLFTAFRWHFCTGRMRGKNRKALLVTQAACIWMTLQNVVTQSHNRTPLLISHLTCYSKVRPSITLPFSLLSDWDRSVLLPWPPATFRTENQSLHALSQSNNLAFLSQLCVIKNIT